MAARDQARSFTIAIDTGGTFTDCVWIEQGRIRLLKVLSTPADPSQAIAQAVEKIGARESITLLHGTTVGTNTLLERRGARVALVTNAGFEDVIEIGRQARPKLYDFFFERVEPLVPRQRRFGVEERTAAGGEILQGLSTQGLKGLGRRIGKSRSEAIAISLLFSFANPQSELAIARALKTLNLPLSVSHEILPEFREYERTSTVVINAYLQPVMQRYLQNLERRGVESAFRGRSCRIFVMQSSGGIAALRAAAREPVRTVLSGPAGGVVGAATMARRSGFDRIISFDMGGTSTVVALVDGKPQAVSQSEVAGLPVGVPMLDIHTVGAGGGSIARFDAAGALRVGPESAGADPGPICYGRGVQPTVTDANLILGRLHAERFLGGSFKLDAERTRRVVRQWLRKEAARMTIEQFAAGVIRVVNASMEKAIRVVSVERGYDTREFTLVAFGGAGGLHAVELAAALGIPRVLVPALPGGLSAFGILVSDVVKDYSRTVLWRLPERPPLKRISAQFEQLRRLAEIDSRREDWRGRIQYERTVDLRYRGQGYELNVPFSRNLVPAFRDEHQRRYGYSYPGREVELVTLRLRATRRSLRPSADARIAGNRARLTPEKIALFHQGKAIAARIYERDSIARNKRLAGPAIVAEYSATTYVPPGMRFVVDEHANLIISVKGKSRSRGAVQS